MTSFPDQISLATFNSELVYGDSLCTNGESDIRAILALLFIFQYSRSENTPRTSALRCLLSYTDTIPSEYFVLVDQVQDPSHFSIDVHAITTHTCNIQHHTNQCEYRYAQRINGYQAHTECTHFDNPSCVLTIQHIQ